MQEIWKDVDGFEGKYKVSNLGNVLSLDFCRTGKPKLLKPKHHHTGYLIVRLCNGAQSKQVNKSIHSLVANAFIPNPDNKRCINHIDGDKTNNHVSNLEWVTHAENSQHAIKSGLRDPHKNNHPKGSKVVNSRKVAQWSLSGRFIRQWDCISDAARFINCKPCMIINNAKGRTESCHGYKWSYTE